MSIKLFLFTFPMGLGLLMEAFSPAVAQMNCRQQIQFYNERWYDGTQWRISRTHRTVLNCDPAFGNTSPPAFSIFTVPSKPYPSVLPQNYPFPITDKRSVIVNTGGGSLDTRSGPGLDYPIVSNILNHSYVRISGTRRNGWLQLDDGGWVHSVFLRDNPLNALDLNLR